MMIGTIERVQGGILVRDSFYTKQAIETYCDNMCLGVAETVEGQAELEQMRIEVPERKLFIMTESPFAHMLFEPSVDITMVVASLQLVGCRVRGLLSDKDGKLLMLFARRNT